METKKKECACSKPKEKNASEHFCSLVNGLGLIMVQGNLGVQYVVNDALTCGVEE